MDLSRTESLARPVVLCADDYGLAPGVSRAIAELIADGRLSATSCMTISPFWPDHAQWLKPLRGRADIGLHLTFTDQKPLGPMPDLAPDGRLPPLGRLLGRALTRRLDPQEIRREVGRQIDAFEAAWGAPPDFIDGHQHVHQLPVIRDALLFHIRNRLADSRPYIRCCNEPLTAILRRGIDPFRAAVISLLGRGLRRRLARGGIAHNDSFRGVYDFSPRIPYPELFRRFLADAGPRTLIMCHPGLVDDALRAADPLTGQRETEYRYFLSDEFAGLLQTADFRLARFA